MSAEKKRIKEQMLVNQAIASIKRQLNELENSRKKYIAAAVKARECGIASQYNLAKNAIRIVTQQRLVVEQMLLNLQLSSQIKDVSEMTKSFADGMKILSGSIVETTGGLNFEKVTKQMNKAMVSTQMKQAETEAFLDATEAGFSAFASGHGTVEDEIDRMLENELTGNSAGLDAELAELERKIKEGGVGGNV
ncbi:MAG: hypothetical protein HDT28_06240 [Clostridiales bacterium]|nr:hypothetical protein [Clostridiales bacterium]